MDRYYYSDDESLQFFLDEIQLLVGNPEQQWEYYEGCDIIDQAADRLGLSLNCELPPRKQTEVLALEKFPFLLKQGLMYRSPEADVIVPQAEKKDSFEALYFPNDK